VQAYSLSRFDNELYLFEHINDAVETGSIHVQIRCSSVVCQLSYQERVHNNRKNDLTIIRRDIAESLYGQRIEVGAT